MNNESGQNYFMNEIKISHSSILIRTFERKCDEKKKCRGKTVHIMSR